MEYRFEYKSEEEKESIIKENPDLYVVGYEFLLEDGDFVVMSEEPPRLAEPTEIDKLKNEISILEAENAGLLLDSAIKDLRIQTTENDIADLTLEMAMIGGK